MQRQGKDVHICSQCGTVSISGHLKCPGCGADDQSGWSRIDIYEAARLRNPGKNRTGNEKIDLTALTAFVSETWANYWKLITAAIIIPALLLYLLPPAWAFGIFIVFVGFAVASRFIHDSRGRGSKRLYRQLLRKAGGDKALASRLIEHERRKNPDADIREWLAEAIIRWERDRK